MKIILFMASTLNGIIATETGNEDFLSDLNWKTFKNLAEKMGCFIVGRKTYDNVKNWEHNFNEIKADMIVISKNNIKNITTVTSPEEAIKKAKEMSHKQLLLAGGGMTNTMFIKKNLINEIILNIEPTILGKGIRLFKEDDFEKRLNLIDTKTLKEGIVKLHYKVK